MSMRRHVSRDDKCGGAHAGGALVRAEPSRQAANWRLLGTSMAFQAPCASVVPNKLQRRRSQVMRRLQTIASLPKRRQSAGKAKTTADRSW